MFNNKIKTIQFLRFCTVGLANTAVDITAFFVLTSGGLPYLLAQVLSYSAGIANSFFLNRKWTFQLKHKTNISELAKFLIVNCISLLLSSFLLFILKEVHHVDLGISKVAATGISMVLNFIGSRLWVFSETPTLTGDAL